MKISIPIPRKLNTDVFSIYVSLIMFMPLTTLLQYQLEAINKVLFAVIFLLQMIVLVKRIDRKNMLFMATSLFAYIVVLYNTSKLTFDNQIVYYVNWLIYSSVITLNKDKFFNYLKNNEFMIKAVMFIWSFLVGISIFMPSSYYVKEGGARYFSSYTETIFRLAPTALFIEILALISIVIYKHRKDIIYTFIPLFCGFMGSSRTYFVVIVTVFVICLYYFTSTKTRFALAAIPSGIIGVVLFGMSSMNEKVQYTLDESQFGDLLYRITSGRSLIWETNMRAYKNLPFSKQFFGSGFGFTNRLSMAASINREVGLYAHNDFVEILATHGILGILLYIFAFTILFSAFFKNKKVPVFIWVLTIFSWAFNAFFNMFYWYTCAALSYPFLLAAISLAQEAKSLANKEQPTQRSDTEDANQ